MVLLALYEAQMLYSGRRPTLLFDSVAIVQHGFGGTGIEGQDITLRTVIFLVDPHGPIPMDCQRATTERLIAGSTQANCRIGENIEHTTVSQIPKESQMSCHPKPQAPRDGVLSSHAGMGHRKTGPHN